LLAARHHTSQIGKSAMVNREKLESVELLSGEILRHLESGGRPLDAATLVREFCKKYEVNAETAEVALSFLFNKGLIEMDREMQLNSRKTIEAA